MVYEVRRTQSWGSKVGGGFKAILLGFLLLIAGTALLFWNEGRAVKTTNCINDVEREHVPLGAITPLNTELNGQLVYAQGEAKTNEILQDPRFNISQNALALRYKIEYYQWVEHESTREEKQLGGSTETVTTYTYNKEWVSKPIDSSRFHSSSHSDSNLFPRQSDSSHISRHNNSTLLEIDDKEIRAKDVDFGAYKLPSFLYLSINSTEAINLHFTDKDYIRYADSILNFEAGVNESEMLERGKQIVHLKGNRVYFGFDESKPSIGDVRVEVSHIPPSVPVSFVAELSENTFVKYQGKSCKDGYAYGSLYEGNLTSKEVFERNRHENTVLTWLLRLAGVLLVFSGFASFFKLGEALLDLLPFLGNVVGFLGKLIAALLALAWSLVVIAIAWLFYRPILAGILIVISIVIIIIIVKRKK